MTDTAENVSVLNTTETPVPNTVVTAAGTPDAAKAVGDGKTAESTDAKGDVEKAGAPEKYEAFKFSDGLEVDQPAMDAFMPIAKELNLTQAQAQKLVDLQSEFVQQGAKAEQLAWDTMQADWVKAARTDKEIGGAGFNDNVAHAAKAIKQFGTPELKAALDATGVGNHPEFIRVFAKIGKAISEDKFHVSNAEVAPEPQSWADRLFPNQGKQGV